MPHLDGLRAIAVLMVMAEHLWHGRVSESYRIFPWGSAGVTLFFVLSGFLITGILLGYREKAAGNRSKTWSFIGTFYKRRALRIFPLYYLLAILLLVLPFYHPREYWPYFLYASNFYIYGLDSWGEPYGHTWSLAVEEQFYLIWPFVILFVPFRALKRSILLFIGFSLAFRLFAFGYLAPHHSLIGLLTPSSFDAFGLGAWLAYVRRYENPVYRFEDWKKWGVLLALVAVICLNTWYEPFNFGVLFFLGLAVVSVWAIARASLGATGVFGPVLASAPMRFIGRISYGLYMWHMPAMGYYDQLILWSEEKKIYWPGTQDYLFSRFLDYPLGYTYVHVFMTFVLALLSYYLLERPLLRLKDRVSA